MTDLNLTYTLERQAELIANYNSILSQIQTTIQTNQISRPIQLLPVSKLKPASDIQALYDFGLREFGENYTQELIGKAGVLPKDIIWHFIGGLQSSKPKDLNSGSIENLIVETIDSLKKVKKLDENRNSAEDKKTGVYVQINTSEEDQKYGLALDNLEEIESIITFILKESKNLELHGLMTIGSFLNSHAEGEENEDFTKLVNLKKQLDAKFGVDLKLSMGMSSDFKQAIKQGSSEIRVGTDIFGSRPPRA
ncbi:hypothetical protein WICPIJ_004762 [Wickerhamomyces pijperi]|uniref:Pyridoxal phosphate homeostasis protein n=1 Tax=Wickerhamomyces pijperi TaxID=599730 RepID=A0A9P8TMK4_WICPI|nr:hypothetical protein WICPIJ_004762 [Wickerhamomyces pijperi]